MPKDTYFNLPAEKQEKIVVAAIKEFAYKGFENGNIGEIAKNAGVSKGSMYQYFESKKELYGFLIDKSFDKTLQYAKVIDYDHVSIYEYFIEGFKVGWTFMQKDHDLFLFLQGVGVEGIRYNKEALTKFMVSSHEFNKRMIEINKKNGFIRADIDTETVAIFTESVIARLKLKMLEFAKNNNKDFCNTTYEEYKTLIEDTVELLKTGMNVVVQEEEKK